MTTNKSRGAFQVTSSEYSVFEVNDVLRKIREELDELQGLRGLAQIYHKLRVTDPPTKDDEAVRLGDTFIILGLGITVFVIGDLLYANSTDTLTVLGIGASGTALTSNGTIPGWGSTVAAWTATGLLTAATMNVGSGTTVSKIISATATLNFPNTLPGTGSDLTITLTGAVDGDVVLLGVPNGSIPSANCGFFAWVSAADTVTVRFLNAGSLATDPASGTFRVAVVRF